MSSEHVWRYTLLGTTLSVLALFIVWQTIRIQLDPEQVQRFIEEGKTYEGEWHTYYPPRGLIYDRWGHLLAGNTTVYEIGAELGQVKNPHTIALTMNVVLGLDYHAFQPQIHPDPSGHPSFRPGVVPGPCASRRSMR